MQISCLVSSYTINHSPLADSTDRLMSTDLSGSSRAAAVDLYG